MEKQDMNDLWKLLAVYRKDDPHLKDSTLKAAWLLVLEPFQKDDVRAAVGAYFREKGYWPNVTEIAQRCPQAASTKVASSPDLKLSDWWAEHKRKLEALGLPTRWAARESGMTFAEYNELLEAHGL